MYDRMQELYRFSHCSEPFFKHMEFCKNQERFDERLTTLFERSGNGFEDQERWTFLGSIFFVNSLVTTIGYGSMYPRTSGGMLSSIGFGDYLPSNTASRVFTMFFIILGLGTASSTIKTMMTTCESSTEPLVTKLGDSYATFVSDCDCCTGDRAEPNRPA